MKRKLLGIVAAAGVLALYAACSDNSTAPKTGVTPGQRPLYNFQTPFNDAGVCMANDAVSAPTGTIAGIKNGDDPLTATNCTSNDVSVAHADLLTFQVTDANGNFLPPVTYTGQQVTCIEGSPLKLNMTADLDETANSARADIGIWIAIDGGNAITGQCNHYNLTTNPLETGVTNPDGDHCGDLASGAVASAVPLGVIDAICQTASDTSTTLHIGSCLGWKEPGADAVCPLNSTEDPQHYRWGTLFANKSKCNCDGFDVPITVQKKAKLEIAKVCDPTTDAGTFDLLIDGSTTVNAVVVGDNKACGTSTGAQTLSAGTNASPGAAHTFGEGDFTTANYTSSYSCVNRSASGPQHVFTASGDAAATGSSLGPNQITLQPNEDVICTYTNVRKPQVKLVKVLDPTTDPGLVEFAIGASNFDNSGNGYGNNGTTGFQNVSVGTVVISETAHTGTNLANYTSALACVDGASQTVSVSANTGTSGTISVAAGQQVTCTFTNTRKPRLTVNKVCSPTTDGGKFNLQIDAATAGTGANAACGGTTGTVTSTIGAHTVGETAGTGTDLSNYTTAISGDCAADGTVSLAAGDNKTCTITNTRKGTLTVNKVCSPTTDGGKFNLQIDGATAGTGANAACGGTTGAVFVSLTSHTVGETAGTGTSLSDYTTVISGDCAANGSVTVNAGDNKVCTITNTRKPKLTVNKVCAPTTDGGHFNLQIDGSNAGTGADAACGGTTGAVFESIGSHTVGETAGTGTNLSDYNTAISGDCAADGTVSLAAGDSKTCTITNTRKPTLTVNKVCAPTTDGGLFNLRIDGSTAGTGANAACGGTTGAVVETIGSHTASETAGTGTDLANYDTAISGDCAADGTVSLAAGDHKTCTITNTRKPRLTVNKVCSPTTDAGKFNLQIDGSTAGTGADAACGGTTGTVTSTIGAHTVSETAGTATSLTDYNTAISGDCAANGSVSLAAGDNKTCTITNTRKGTLTVNKVCAPTTDGGHFNLQIDGSNAGTGANAACGGTTGAVVVAFTSHTVGETAGTGTSLTDYTMVISGDCAADGTVTVSAGDSKVCTITNTRKPKLTVNKVCDPTTDGGHFNLRIDGTAAGTGADAACGGTTGAVFESIGGHVVSETAGTGTDLANYTKVIGGDCASDGSVSLAAGDNKTCTITNTRKPTLTVNKVCAPTTDGGHFNLQIDGSNAGTGADAACGGTTGAVFESIGSHTVGETAGTGTDLSNYTSAISGDCAADGTVSLAAGDHKTCTITNTRKPKLTVNKVCAPTTDGGKFNLRIDGSTAGTGADASCGGTTGAVFVSIGSHTVSETGGTGTSLGDYTSAISGDCASDGTVSLAAGESKTCTITNTRKPKLTVNKVCSPTTDGGHFNLRIDGSTAGTGADAACGGTTGAVVVSIGSHTVSETAGTGTSLSGYITAISGDCAADGTVSLAAGDNKTCTITNTVSGNGLIAPTATTCEDFVGGTAGTLSDILAQIKSGKINAVSPGVFFYYATVAKGSGSTGFTQTVVPGSVTLPKYQVQQGQAYLYTVSGGTCTKAATLTADASGNYSGGGSLPAGNYILGVKFATDAIKGTAAPLTPQLLSTHVFTLTGGGSTASVKTDVKP